MDVTYFNNPSEIINIVSRSAQGLLLFDNNPTINLFSFG